MRRSALLLVLLACLTCFAGLGGPAITDADEAYYAEASREMVASGDWLTPHYNFNDRWEKPVLYYWLTAATFRVTGPTEGSARLWSALSGIGLALLAVAMARTAGARHDAAWLAGAIVATCFGCFAMARMALPDLPLAFCITLTVWGALRAADAATVPTAGSPVAWWALAGLAAALGWLMKGPVALVVPGVVLLPIWWRERRTLAIPPAGVAVALALFLLVGMPWYVAMLLEHGRAYFDSFFIGDNLERFSTDRFNEPRPFWFYLPVLLGGLFPWSAWAVAFAIERLRGGWRAAWRMPPGEWRLLCWTLMPLLLFTLSIGKQPRYILPVLPPLAVLVAQGLAGRVRAAQQPGAAATGLRWPALATGLLFLVLAALLLRARPLFVHVAALVPLLGALLIAACGVALMGVALARRWQLLIPTSTATAVVLLLTVQYAALDGRRPEPVEQMAALVTQHRQPGDRLASYRVFVRNLVFYTRQPQTALPSESAALDYLRAPGRALLVVEEQELRRLETALGTTLTPLASVRYLSTADLRIGTLLWPDPSRDVRTVRLVATP